MVEFITNILISSARRWGPLGLALGETALIFRIFLIPVVQSYYKSTVLADALQERIDTIYKKTKDPQEAGKKVTKLLTDMRYPSLGMITYLILFLAVALLLTSPLLLAPETLLDGSFSMGLGNLFPDVTISPFSVLSSGNPGASALAAFAAPIAVAAVTFFHDRTFSQHSAVLRQNFDFIVLAAITAGAVLLPVGFSICWFIMELIGILQSQIVRRLFHVQLKQRTN